MAQQTIVSYIDDIDGTEAAETIPFGIDGKTYEIDLSEEHAVQLRDALAEFVASARRTGAAAPARKPRRQGGTAPARMDKEQNQAIREFAREQGFKVSNRGRIPAEVMDAYNNRETGPGSGTALRPTDAPTEDQPATDEPTKLSAVPAFDDGTPTDAEIMAWWTGVRKAPEPKGGKVTGPMRRAFAEYQKSA